jgi:hypothetical protein
MTRHRCGDRRHRAHYLRLVQKRRLLNTVGSWALRVAYAELEADPAEHARAQKNLEGAVEALLEYYRERLKEQAEAQAGKKAKKRGGS